jgi:hypothetical protein
MSFNDAINLRTARELHCIRTCRSQLRFLLPMTVQSQLEFVLINRFGVDRGSMIKWGKRYGESAPGVICGSRGCLAVLVILMKHCKTDLDILCI